MRLLPRPGLEVTGPGDSSSEPFDVVVHTGRRQTSGASATVELPVTGAAGVASVATLAGREEVTLSNVEDLALLLTRLCSSPPI